MKVIVTGATSFIAKKYIQMASQLNWEIIAVVRHNSPKAKEFHLMHNVKILELDMTEYGIIGGLVGKSDCLIHFAWSGVRGNERNDKELQERNYYSTMSLIEGVARAGTDRIITIGSQAEYGIINVPIDENCACNPNTEYGKYKYKVFTEVSEMCKNAGIRYKEPRIFSLYGPGDFSKTLVMSCIDSMEKDLPCQMTLCEQGWDFLYIDDAVDALIKLTAMDCQDGAYNIASGDYRKLKDYVLEMKTVLGSSSELDFGAVPYGETGVISIHPVIKKIEEQTGWRATTSFADGIRKMLTSRNKCN